MHQFVLHLLSFAFKCVSISTIVLFSCTLQAKLTLSEKTNPIIIIAEDATPSEKFAARELATYLGRILNCEIPLRQNEGEGGTPIFIGAHPKNAFLKPETLDLEESIVHIAEGSIHVVGGRSKELTAGGSRPIHDRGTLYGVYDLLEELGVRWYRPEPWGEHVPVAHEVTLQKGQRKRKPAFKYRYGIHHYRTYMINKSSDLKTPEEKNMRRKERRMITPWVTRNRLNTNVFTTKSNPEFGGEHRINFAHAYKYLVPPGRYFKTHPEYYALVNGVRSSNPEAQLCLSNPDVEDLVLKGIIREFENFPDLEIASLDPNDWAIWCECDPCRAMDDPALKAGHAGQIPPKLKGISMSNRVTIFNNKIAKRLREILPGKRVGWYAYAMHTEPPTKVDHLEEGTAVMAVAFAGSFSDYSRGLYDSKSPQNARFLEVLKGWKKLTKSSGSSLLAHDYWSFYIWPGPLPVLNSMRDKLKAYHRDFGIEGVYNEVHPCWGPQGMVLYFYTWLLRNPEGDFEREKEYYYRSFYGPAAEAMKLYHEELERAAWGGAYHGSGGSSAEAIFTNKLLDRLAPSVVAAEQAAKDNEVIEKRVSTVLAGFYYAKKVRAFQNALGEMQVKDAENALKDLEEYFYSFKDGSVFDNDTSPPGNVKKSFSAGIFSAYRGKLKKEAALHKFFNDPKLLQRHETGWRFQTDPKGAGEAMGWMRSDFSDEGWPRLTANTSWQNQGYGDYKGVAWYRKQLTVPRFTNGYRLILHFGSVDGNATVYLKGETLGEHQLDPVTSAGWDAPFYFDITDLVKPGSKVQLVVRVEKDKYDGGLTAPVSIVEASSIRPPE